MFAPTTSSLFALGQIVATPAAIEAMAQVATSSKDLLKRHLAGDWSDMCAEDQTANQIAIECTERVFSAYLIAGVKFWIITEADRSATTILLPDDY